LDGQHGMARLIRELREPTGLTQEKSAAKLGVTFPTINRWENDRAKPSPLALEKIESLLRSQFADQKAHDGGEYFTPVSLVSLVANIIEPTCGTVLDPACGSGGIFVQSARVVERRHENPTEKLTFYGLEKNATTIRLVKMNLAVIPLPKKRSSEICGACDEVERHSCQLRSVVLLHEMPASAQHPFPPSPSFFPLDILTDRPYYTC
jgi:transcriptional regulator with XRE-family HTH domain